MLLGMSTGIWVCLIVGAVIIDWIVGDPTYIPHPIVLIGKYIGFWEKHLNKGGARKLKGLLMWVIVIFTTGVCVFAVQEVTMRVHMGLYYIVNLWLLQTTIAQKCLKDEVYKVCIALWGNDLDLARKQTGYLVGRDTTRLNANEIIRAVVETTAENTIDGILAPIFYMIIGCIVWRYVDWLNPLVWAMAYKAVNTMDSMVGYVQEPYKDFGYFPAKLDDVFNFAIARIGSVFMILGGMCLGYNGVTAWRIYRRDRLNHKSPNSAHPESVVAGLLGIQLGGNNIYFGELVKKPTIGDAGHPLNADDIRETTRIAQASEIVMTWVMCIAFGIMYILG